MSADPLSDPSDPLTDLLLGQQELDLGEGLLGATWGIPPLLNLEHRNAPGLDNSPPGGSTVCTDLEYGRGMPWSTKQDHNPGGSRETSPYLEQPAWRAPRLMRIVTPKDGIAAGHQLQSVLASPADLECRGQNT